MLTEEEGEYYNVPVPEEGEDLTANLKKLRVSHIGIISRAKKVDFRREFWVHKNFFSSSFRVS